METQYKGKERREHERLPCKGVLAQYKREGLLAVLGLKKKGSRPLPVRNITCTGICFLCREQLKTGERLHMTIQFGPQRPTIDVEAVVVWCGEGEGIYPFRAGAGFSDVRDHAREVLSNVEQHVLKKEAWEAWRLRAKERSSRIWGKQDEE